MQESRASHPGRFIQQPSTQTSYVPVQGLVAEQTSPKAPRTRQASTLPGGGILQVPPMHHSFAGQQTPLQHPALAQHWVPHATSSPSTLQQRPRAAFAQYWSTKRPVPTLQHLVPHLTSVEEQTLIIGQE